MNLFLILTRAHKDLCLLSLICLVAKHWNSIICQKMQMIFLYYKFYQLKLHSLFQVKWTNEIPRCIPVELHTLIIEYSGNICHFCGSVGELSNFCMQRLVTCSSCIEICLEHNKLCCKCCGFWEISILTRI